MNRPRTTRTGRAAIAGAALLLTLLTAACVPEPPGPTTTTTTTVAAGPIAASAGVADWGVRFSFRNYVQTGGTITLDGGATRNVDGTFRFVNGTGTYTPATKDAHLQFEGSVNFYKYNGVLDVTLANPRVEITGTTGTIYTRAVSAHR